MNPRVKRFSMFAMLIAFASMARWTEALAWGLTRINLVEEVQTLARTAVCCSSYAQMKFESLAPTKKAMEISIDDGDAPFDFGVDGISRFKAFQLPDASEEYSLTVSSGVMGDTSPGPGFFDKMNYVYFYPIVTFLDSNMKPLGSSDPGQIQTPLGSIVVQINTGNWPGARYAVIHTSQSFLKNGKDIAVRFSGFSVSGATIGAEHGIVHFAGSPVAPNESLEIKLVDLRPHVSSNPDH